MMRMLKTWQLQEDHGVQVQALQSVPRSMCALLKVRNCMHVTLLVRTPLFLLSLLLNEALILY